MKNKAEKTFVEQLKEIQDKFLVRASEYGEIDMDTFDITIGDSVLFLRVEGTDEYDETFAANLALESEEDCIYQSTLQELYFRIDI